MVCKMQRACHHDHEHSIDDAMIRENETLEKADTTTAGMKNDSTRAPAGKLGSDSRAVGKSNSNNHEETSIVPGDFDVICAKGKFSFNHKGNRFLRTLVQSCAGQYNNAHSKGAKSRVVSHVLNTIRANSQNGGFLRRDSPQSPWKQASDRFAREKIGQLFRDTLHSQYKSSAGAKKRRRQATQAHMEESIMGIVQESPLISQTMGTVAAWLRSRTLSDREAATLFDNANAHILSHLKESNAAAKLPSTASNPRED